MMNAPLKIADEVAFALQEGRPVVALESTIITHGMPYPINVETALHTEGCVREKGAIPATIAVWDGAIRVGLSADEIAWLSRLERSSIIKASSADLPFVLSQRKIASTTVSATLVCAKSAGISVFATGGIGGVHRGANETFDISADLHALASSDLVVVCAGAKSILDIGATLEVLESHEVPVFAYGTSQFPAFYYRDSGFKVPRLDSAEAIADVMRHKRSLAIYSGVLVGNPPPVDEALSRDEVEGWIVRALIEADDAQIRGKALTPFLLEQLSLYSSGRTLACNVALIKNNAQLAAEIAIKMASPRGFEPLLLP